MKNLLYIFFLLSFFKINSQIYPEYVTYKPRLVNSITFNYTGAIQSWTVPAGVTLIFADLKGAQGGNRSTPSGIGGLGGGARAVINVTPGETLLIMVGGQPTTRVAVYGRAGNGGTNSLSSTNVSFAGGGMTAIFRNSDTITNALLVAGGGGGGANQRNGGNGGGLTGDTGNDIIRGGKGSTQTAGGAAGTPLDGQVINPTAGFNGGGGTGGSVNGTSTWNSGGGGGAGYFGGGGGAGGGNFFGSGGGGASWSKSDNNNIEYLKGINSGHGSAVIYF